MIQALCIFYAHTVAAVWAGLGWDMSAFRNVIVCGGDAVRVQAGCLSLRAVALVGYVGIAAAVWSRRAWPFPAGLALGALMSWLRVFALVAMAFARPALFHALHARCGYAVFSASVIILLILSKAKPLRTRFSLSPCVRCPAAQNQTKGDKP
jgi:exosortase/archaeosortase family protein